MNLNIFSIILLSGSVLTLLVSFLVFKRLGRVVRWFGFLMLAISIWALAYGIELSCTTLPQMLLCIDIEYIGIALLPALWIVFIIKFIGNEKWLTRLSLAFIFTIPVLTLLFVWTQQFHHIHYLHTEVDTSGDFPLLSIIPGPWYHVHTVYFYAMLAWGIYLLLYKFTKSNPLYRKQTYLIAASAVIAWGINLIYLLNYRPLKHIDITPFGFIISALVLAIGLLKHNLFSIVPIAKERIFESIEEGVLVLNEYYKVADYNTAMRKQILALNIEEKVIGFDFEELFTLQNTLIELIKSRSNHLQEAHTTILHNSRFFDTSVTPLFDKKHRFSGVILIFRDITESKIIAEQLKQQTEELASLNKLKDKIFSIIAHDLRTPLVNLTEILKLTSKGILEQEEFYKILPIIQKDIQHTTGFLENLLQWSKSQLQGQVLNRGTFAINECAKYAIELFDTNAKEKGITIDNQLTNKEVFADRNMIQLVFRNLISNAIKFCKANDVITISAKRNGSFITICISDTGIGIGAESMQKLFGQQVFTTRGSKNEAGTGLGLVLCKEFVEKNQGSIWVESELGKGSRFSFSIPTQ